jgi:CHAT domain-containing protein
MLARQRQILAFVFLTAAALWHTGDAAIVDLSIEQLIGSTRWTPGRLPGFTYASFPTPAPKLVGARRRVLLRAWARGHERFLSPLVLGQEAHRAIESAIENLLGEQPSPRRACQLSALQLGLVETGDWPLRHASHALTLAEKALRTEPDLAEAHFNRALALEKLFLNEEATAAWAEYLRRDESSPWADEARSHQRRLRAVIPHEKRLRRALLRLNRGASPEQAVAFAEEFPQPARFQVERELLSRWAQAEKSRDRAATLQELRRARLLARAVAQTAGDQLPLASVQAIDDASRSGDVPRLKALAEGHLALAAAIRQHEASIGCREEAEFQLSEERLHAGGSPMALWAIFYQANCGYRLRDYVLAGQLLKRLAPHCTTSRYRSLCGRVHWLEGLMAFHQNRLSEAFAAYTRARELLGAERPYLAAVHLFQAEVFLLWGERSHAWESLASSLADLETIPSAEIKRRQAILQGAARLAGADGDIDTALRFADAALRIARSSPGHLDDALVLRERAQFFRQRGALRLASFDFRVAAAPLRGAPDLQSQSLWAEVQLLHGEMAAIRPRPDQWMRWIAVLEQTKNRLLLPRAFLALGRAQAQERDLAAAERAWQRGLRELDSLRPSLAGRFLSDFFERHDALLAALLPAQIQLDPTGERAFDSVERARWRSSPHVVRPRGEVTIELVRRSLPSNHVLLEYAVLPDRLLLWVIGADHVQFLALKIPARQLGALLDRLRSAQESERLAALGELYRILVLPAREAIPPGSILLLVPDWRLYGVPFAALYDADRGRFLVEDHKLTVLPDAFSSLPVDGLRSMLWRPPISVLALGDPAFSRAQHPRLPRLPEAASEAKAIWRLYDSASSRLVTGEQVKPATLFEGLGRYDVIHYGGHALATSPDPALARLVLAPEPLRSGDLAAHELYGRDHSATRLVVLAACETADSGAWVRHGGLEGFVEPLLAGGVRNVLASVWSVDDEAARRQAITFHREISAARDPVGALARAQRQAIRRGEPIGDWAAFAIFGIP